MEIGVRPISSICTFRRGDISSHLTAPFERLKSEQIVSMTVYKLPVQGRVKGKDKNAV